MKKWLIALASAAVMAFTPVSAQNFQEGVHYRVVGDTPSSSPEIIDFFSLYCNACYHFAGFSDMLKAEFGDAFKKHHVNLVVPNAVMRDNIQRIHATSIVLGVEEQFVERVFQRHFVRNSFVNTVADAKQIMLDLGVEEAAFDRAFNSFAVTSLSNRMRSLQQQFGVSATPTYVVNRKYQMLQSGFQNSSNFFEEYMALAKYLIEKKD